MIRRVPWDEWFLPAVGSTMDWSRQLTAEEDRRRIPVDALRVRSGRQLTGRGRRGSSWWDAPGASILTTLAVRRGGAWDPGDRNPATMALRAGLAVSRTLEAFHVDAVAIKWPNDIYVNHRKVCGVLVEADPRWFYIGIGLNVESPSVPDGASRELEPVQPGALNAALPRTAGVHSVVRVLDRSLADALLDRDWVDAVRSRLVWTGLPVRLQVESHPDVTGILDGIDADGAILISDPRSRRVTRYVAGALRASDTD
ncbi:MAG: biotin--[acetyl-CoA-carboxylase] ligase [Alkalispirochaeta sp.]